MTNVKQSSSLRYKVHINTSPLITYIWCEGVGAARRVCQAGAVAEQDRGGAGRPAPHPGRPQHPAAAQLHPGTPHTITQDDEAVGLFYLQEVAAALSEYEVVCQEAASVGVNITTRQFSYNWDYVQSCFFALTILTTIGIGRLSVVLARVLTGYCRLRELCCGNAGWQSVLSPVRNNR